VNNRKDKLYVEKTKKYVSMCECVERKRQKVERERERERKRERNYIKDVSRIKGSRKTYKYDKYT